MRLSKPLAAAGSLFLAIILVSGALLMQSKNEPQMDIVEDPQKEGRFTCTFDGEEREFFLFIPPQMAKERPLVFMLHGYSGMAEAFRQTSGMDAYAAQYGYAVVYPQAIPDPVDRTSGAGWNSGLRESPKDDVGFLKALARCLQNKYAFSKKHTFAVGFSNGALMTYRLAMEASDTFRAVASVGGSATQYVWEERPDKLSIGVLQINGTKDDIVPMKGVSHGSHGKAPYIDEVIAYFAQADGLDQVRSHMLSEKAEATCYYNDEEKNIVCYTLVTDGRHSWIEEKYSGIQIDRLILEFFDYYQDYEYPSFFCDEASNGSLESITLPA